MNRPLSAARGVSPWAWVLAVSVHILFVMVLVFGVAWQHQVVAPVEAELWSELPAPATVTKPPMPQPAPPPAPAPPPPAPAPVKPVQPAPPPVPSAADIALKKKQARELEAKKQTQNRERAVAEQIRQQRAEAVKEQQQEEAQRKKAAQLAKAAQDAKAALIDRYKLAIINKIRGNTEVPEGVPSGTTLEVDLTVLPTGEVMMPVRIVKSSGNALYDQAVVRGIMRSQPLPLPAEPELRREFRTTHLQLKHEK